MLKNSVLDGVWGTWFTALGRLGAVMRGTDETTGALFSYVDLEERIPARRPPRKVRAIVIDALASMDADFDRLYAKVSVSWPTRRSRRSCLTSISRLTARGSRPGLFHEELPAEARGHRARRGQRS